MLASGGRVDAAGRPTGFRGSWNGILLTGHPGAVVPTGPASASPCGAVLRSWSSRPTSLGVGLSGGAASPVPYRPQVAVSDSATDSASGLSPEEEQAYQEMMAARKAERKAWKQEMRRRAKFDPMAAPKRPGMTVANAPSSAGASDGTAAPGAPATPAAAAPPAPALSRPRAPAPPGAAAQPKAPAPGTAMPPPAATAAASSLRVKLPRPGPPPPPQPQAPSAPSASGASAAARRREQAAAAADEEEEAGITKRPAAGAAAAADDGDEELDLDGMAAMARKIMADRDEDADGQLEAVEESSTSSSGKKAVPPRGAAGAAPLQPRRPGAPAPKRALMPIAQLQRQRAAAAAAAAAEGQQQLQPKQQQQAGSSASAAAAVRNAAAGGKRAAAAPVRRPAEAEPAVADEEDDLDWDALEAYEKYEEYVNEVTEEETRAARAAARRASSSAASTSAPAAGSTAAKAAAKGRRAGGKAKAVSADPEDALDSQLDQWEQLLNFFEVVEKNGKREEARRRKAAAEAAAAEAAAEAAEGGGAAAKAAKAKGGKGAAAAKAGAAAAGAAAAAAAGGMSLAAELEALGLLGEDGDGDDEARGEVEVDWQSMERLFLGEGWESELAELKAKVEASAQEVDAAMAAAEAAEGGAGPVEGWRDEVSTLLLGLVEISAKRYLGRSLLADTPAAKAAAAAAAANPPAPAPAPAAAAAGAGAGAGSLGAAAAAAASSSPLPEEERPVAFWEAPYMLLVQDDSEDPQLEYANRTALAALGFAAFDDATGGLSAAGLADATHPASQAEWLWACTEAAERPEQFSTIPSLRLRGPGPGAPAVLASGVTVFRVDSLEGEPIGQAVVVDSWRRLSAEEEAAEEAA